MREIPDCQIGDWLIEDSAEFRDAVAGLSPKCWARYDLSAVRVGWELAGLNARAVDAELERMRADLARVTAERDDYRERWEQTGCTRHHAMETAIKLHESCRQQLEAAVQERDALLKALRAVQAAAEGASGTPTDSVGERLWAIKKIARGALVAASIQQHDQDTAEGEG